MSRTFTKKQQSAAQNGGSSKQFTETTDTDGDDIDVTSSENPRSASNGQDKAHGAEGVVISHSKRKFSDDGMSHFIRKLLRILNTILRFFRLFAVFILDDDSAKRSPN